MSDTATGGALDRLDRNVVHEICTNQVVVTLHACVKELVENALDAGATRIEVRLRESGSELLEVVDNGHGIAAENYAQLAARHATSKIRDYDDLSQSLSTFGFRGEALSAIAAMGDMTVCTRTAGDAAAALLSYDRFGKMASQVAAARDVGTTVSVRELFRRLPVRHREFLRNAKAQVGATLRLVQSYAIAQPEVRFHVVAEKTKGHGAGRATLLSTSGTSSGWRQAAAAVLGDAATVSVEPLELHGDKTGWDISGLISSPCGGRRQRDSQLYFVNRRPVDPPKRIAKLINDTYHQYNSRMWPVVILSFTAKQDLVDVNVTPDKRTVFLHNEEPLLGEIQQALTELFTPKAQGGGPSLGDFGIRSAPKGPAGGAEAAAAAGAQTAAAAALLSASPSATAGGAALGSSPSSAAAPAAASSSEATTPRPTDPPRKTSHVGSLHTPEKPSVPAPESCASSSRVLIEDSLPGFHIEEFAPPSEPEGKAPSASGVAPAPTAAWSQSLQPRHDASEGGAEPAQPEFRIIELDPATLGSGSELGAPPAQEGLQSTGVEAAGVASDAAAMDISDDGGFVLTEFHPDAPSQGAEPPAPPAPWQPSQEQPPRPAAEAPPDANGAPRDMVVDEVGTPAPEAPPAPRRNALGCSIRAAVTLAELSAGVARRRQRAAARGAAASEAHAPGAPRAYFPSAFSLSSLRADEKGRSSIEEVAKFATDGSAEELSRTGLRFDKTCFSKMRVIGQFNLGFIIAALRAGEGDDEQQRAGGHRGLQLFIIDQHASDEKFRFEGLNRESRIDRQPLVAAHHLQLTPAQEQLAESHLEVFRLNGFELHKDAARAPGRRLRLATLPTCQGLVFGERDIHDLLYNLEEAEADQHKPNTQDVSAGGKLLDLAGHRGLWSSTALPRPAKVWQLLACRACRGAVMIGKALRVGEMEKILRNLGSLEHPWNCPHGRPTMRHLIDTAAARTTPQTPPPLVKLLAQVAP